MKEPIVCLRKELNAWKQLRDDYRQSLYMNDSSLGNDNIYRLYKGEIANCSKMMKIYREAIAKLKS